MDQSRILSVGQCGFDHGQIARQLASALDARVEAADTAIEALEQIRSSATLAFDLVLINRVGDSDGAPGVDLIRSLKADPATASLPLMLISDRPEAQEQAEALGALPGFGKSALRDPRTHANLAKILGRDG